MQKATQVVPSRVMVNKQIAHNALGGSGGALGGLGRALGGSLYRKTPDQPHSGHYVSVPFAKYLGFIMGPRIKNKQWTNVLNKWLARGESTAHSHVSPSTAALAYNFTGVPVLGYRAQLILPPHDLEMRERHLMRFMWHMPTNSFELNTLFNANTVGACGLRELVRTHVILAPGACGREGRSAGSGTILSGSAGSGNEFQIAHFRCFLQYLRALDPP